MRKRISDRKDFWLWVGLGVFSLLFYIGFALHDGYQLAPDSGDYISMSIAVEPGYTLFLALLRTVVGGEERWLMAAALLQSALMAWAGWRFTRDCTRVFRLEPWVSAALLLCTILPAVLCRFFSIRGGIYACFILTEGLTYPLYLLLISSLTVYLAEHRKASLYEAVGLALLLLLIRRQTIFCVPLVALAIFYRGLREKRWLRGLVLAVLTTALVLGVSSAVTRACNLAMYGKAEGTAGGRRFVLTELVHYAGEGDAQAIEDPELRALYENIVASAEEKGYLRKDSPDGWFDRSVAYGEQYAGILYDCVTPQISAAAEAKAGEDASARALECERLIGGLIRALLPVAGFRLLETVADQLLMSMIVTATTCKRILVLPTLLLYAVYIVLLVVNIRKEREHEAEFACLTLLAILANCGLIAVSIFAQSRYTLYNMPIFYAALLLLARGAMKSVKSVKSGEWS